MRRRMLPGSLEELYPEEIRSELGGRRIKGGTSSGLLSRGKLVQLPTDTLEMILRKLPLLLKVMAHAA